jgi:hypothetical protein
MKHHACPWFFCGTGVWTLCLHLEPLHQLFYLWWLFFCVCDRVSQHVCPGWLWTMILLISASSIAKILGAQLSPDFSSFLFSFNVTGGWTQWLFLARQAFYHLNHSTNTFLLVRSHFMPRPSWTMILLFVLPYLWMAGTCHCPAIGWDGVSWTFCPSWLQTTILPIYGSQVPRLQS